jgi:hypothetical protein
MAAGRVAVVCGAVWEYPASPAAAREAAATRQAIGFTGFMEDNSTRSDALKIRFVSERLVVPVTNPVTYHEPARL